MNKSINKTFENSAIELMYYGEKENLNQHFYFFGLSIAEILHYFPKNSKIVNLNFVAQYKNDCINQNDLKNKESLNELITFINKHNQFDFFEFDTTLSNNIQISSHDDCEISLTFPTKFKYNALLNKLLTKHNYNSEKVISELMENKNLYIKMKQPDIIEKVYRNFDEFWHEND